MSPEMIKYISCQIRQKAGLNCTFLDLPFSYCDEPANTTILNAVGSWNALFYNQLQEGSNLLSPIVIFFYVLIILVSFFGNLIVCKIVFTGSGKKSTTNLYIGSLSMSDLMMTTINIPLQLTEVLVRNWPLGFFLCKCLHIFGGMSVATSTLTMAFIALDRYQVIAHPLKPRPSCKTTIYKIVFIWIAAFILSFPYSLMSRVTNELSYDNVTRCTVKYPCPDYVYRQIFTQVALLTQFAGPLTVSIITYLKICVIIWKRKSIGAVTKDQKIYQQEAKWKTIKMLIIVLIAFVVCWLPLNIYHTYQDAREEQGSDKHNSTVWLACHWFAMSSVCCNPFIYCWLNDKFRKVAKLHLKWILFIRKTRSPNTKSHFLARNCNMRLTVSAKTNSSVHFSAFSSQSREFPVVGCEEKQSHQNKQNDEAFRKTISQGTIAETTEDATLLSPRQQNLINNYYLSQDKRYKDSSMPENFV